MVKTAGLESESKMKFYVNFVVLVVVIYAQTIESKGNYQLKTFCRCVMFNIGSYQENNNINPFYINEVTKAQPTLNCGARHGSSFATTSATEKGTNGIFMWAIISVKIHVKKVLNVSKVNFPFQYTY